MYNIKAYAKMDLKLQMQFLHSRLEKEGGGYMSRSGYLGTL